MFHLVSTRRQRRWWTTRPGFGGDALLTHEVTSVIHRARVKTSDNRLMVVRAWHDTDRLIIRLIVSDGPRAPVVESVFTDIESATNRLAEVLTELLQAPGPAARSSSPRRETNR